MVFLNALIYLFFVIFVLLSDFIIVSVELYNLKGLISTDMQKRDSMKSKEGRKSLIGRSKSKKDRIDDQILISSP